MTIHRLAAAALVCLAPVAARAQQVNLYSTNETVAFEDLTASSDADQNDLVVRVNARCRVTSGGTLLNEEIHLTAVAAGATRTDQLVLLPVAVPTSATIDTGAGPVALPPSAQITLTTDARSLFAAPTEGFVNTTADPIVAGVPITVRLTWASGPTVATCARPGLALARPADGVLVTDTTTLATGQPLLGRFPDAWQVPTERTAVSAAYPQFLGWLADHVGGCVTGCVNETWYQSPGTAVVSRPALATDAPLAPAATCTDGVLNQDETEPDCGGGVCGACGQAFRYWRLLTRSGTVTSGWNLYELKFYTEAVGGTALPPLADADVTAQTFYSTTVGPGKSNDGSFGTAYNSLGPSDAHFVGNGTDWLRFDFHTPVAIRRIDDYCYSSSFAPSLQVQGSASSGGPWTDVGPVQPGGSSCVFIGGTPAGAAWLATYAVQ